MIVIDADTTCKVRATQNSVTTIYEDADFNLLG